MEGCTSWNYSAEKMKSIHHSLKSRRGIVLAVFLFAFFSIHFAPPATCAAGLVPCTNDCDLCYLLVGISNIFQWLTGSLLGLTIILGITISGLTFIVSGAFPKVLAFAKSSITATAKGAFWALCGWLIINSVMNIVGYKNPQGGHWWQHECAGGTAQVANNSGANNPNNNKTACDPKNRKLESIKIQCAEKDFKLEGDGTGFYVVLDTLSADGKGKTKQLKALAKYTCDGTTSEEDITAQAEWKASDETQIKVAKGLVQAVTTSLGSSSESVPYVEAKYQDKNSNQAKVYINACPNMETAGAAAKNNFLFSENGLAIPKANAQTWDCPNCKTQNSGGTTCKSCGQNDACHFVYGNENAKYIFILVRTNSRSCDDFYTTATGSVIVLHPTQEWNKNDKSEYESFKSAVEKMSKDISFAPDGKNNFAVYRSDLIAQSAGSFSDPSCPKGTFVSNGFICKNKMRANAKLRGYAYYSLQDIFPTLLAHEQIGHAFAQLDDEYEECGKDLANFSSPHYNCTSKDKVKTITQSGWLWNSVKYETKWGQLDDAKLGCGYSQNYYRPTENSIMRNNRNANRFISFGPVGTKVINDTVKDFLRGGPLEWVESLSAQCSVKK